MTVKSIEDLVNKSSNDDSTDSETETEGVTMSLPDVFVAIGADKERVKAEIRDSGNDEELEKFAKKLADDGELWAAQEAYRRYSDLHRFKQNYLLNDNKRDYTMWAAGFYGDSDDPEPDTYNGVQQKSRDIGGNLYFYKTMFPEPVEEYWDSDPVLLVERPDDDSHIYVTEGFVDTYGQFTMEVEGKTVVRPPSDAEIKELRETADVDADNDKDMETGDDTDFLLTNDMTNDEVKEEVEKIDNSEMLRNTLTFEQRTKNRKGAKDAIQNRLDIVEQQEAAQQSLEESASSDDDDDDEFQYQCGQCDKRFKEHSKIVTHDCEG